MSAQVPLVQLKLDAVPKGRRFFLERGDRSESSLALNFLFPGLDFSDPPFAALVAAGIAL